MLEPEEAEGRGRWGLALLGLFLFVFAVVALSAPGRVDTIDAQNRYFVAQSLYERGNPAITPQQQYDVFQDRFDFLVVIGRDENKYSTYRLPHSVLGAGALAVADATDVPYETRRYFFFSLINSVSAGLLAVAYALWFRQQGLSRLAAVGWALGGMFCTPNWFFGTSSYDDLLGVPAVVFGLWAAGWGASATSLVTLDRAAAPAPRRGWGAWLLAGLKAVFRSPVTAYRALDAALHERSRLAAAGAYNRRAYLGAAVAGLAFGIAFNCKEPLAIWVFPAYALVATGLPRWRSKIAAALALTVPFALCVGVHFAYEVYKFPPKWEQPLGQTIEEMKERQRQVRAADKDEDEVRRDLLLAVGAVGNQSPNPLTTLVPAAGAVKLGGYAEDVPEPNQFLLLLELIKHQDFVEKQLQGYMRAFPGTPLEGTLCLLVSPQCGIVWYCPPVILGIGGLVRAFRRRWVFAVAMTVACVGFFLFIASIRFFKGDLSWGPRYLTPLYAVLWLFVPRVRDWPRWLVVQLLALGVLVQLMALPVSAQRIYIQKNWFPEAATWGTLFNLSPLPAQMLQRPVEIGEILHEDGSKVERFSLSRYPTASSPINHFPGIGPDKVRKYHYLCTWRFWWVSMWYLDEAERPVDIARTAALLEGTLAAGLVLMLPVWLARKRRAGPGPEVESEKEAA